MAVAIPARRAPSAPPTKTAASNEPLTPRRFGTDGIRGVANVDLTAPLAYALGRATAQHLVGKGGRLLVGQDTRRSGDMLVSALVAGATSMGADVARLGVCPTPALAYLTPVLGYGAGVMVSASHNPADDNGLKVLDGRGLKLDDRLEIELEALIDGADRLVGPGNDGLGRELDRRFDLARYVEHRSGLANPRLAGMKVALDCANGAASVVAPMIMGRTHADLRVIFDAPDGRNINAACGATAPAALAATVARDGADVGFALDGDADRCVAVDERGEIVDGDRLLGIIALDLLSRNRLAASTIVVTVLSNSGLTDVVEAAGGRVMRTPVGDKHVLDGMLTTGAGLGGEKSGHVIVREHTMSGDGIVTALTVLDIMGRTGCPLSQLAARIPLYPQAQRTVRVRDWDGRHADPVLAAALRDAEAELAGRGRLLVRPSGTEPALRIMVEGQDEGRVSQLADALAQLARERLS